MGREMESGGGWGEEERGLPVHIALEMWIFVTLCLDSCGKSHLCRLSRRDRHLGGPFIWMGLTCTLGAGFAKKIPSGPRRPKGLSIPNLTYTT